MKVTAPQPASNIMSYAQGLVRPIETNATKPQSPKPVVNQFSATPYKLGRTI